MITCDAGTCATIHRCMSVTWMCCLSSGFATYFSTIHTPKITISTLKRAQPTNRALEATSSDEAETPVIVGPPDFDEWWGKLESIKQQKYKNTPVSDNMKKTFILNLWNIFSKKTNYKTSDNEPPRWRKSKKNRFEATTSKKLQIQ